MKYIYICIIYNLNEKYIADNKLFFENRKNIAV